MSWHDVYASEEFQPMKLQDWLEEQPFTLSLSSGFFGFFAHTGFVKALEERGLKPTCYTGASAGAIVAGALAGGIRAVELEEIIVKIKLNDFFDPSFGVGLLRGDKFERLLRQYFAEGLAKPQAPIKIATFNIANRKTVTFSDGDLVRAIRASAALPGMFHPVKIDKQYYWDGGILDKHALDNVDRSERVLSHSLNFKSRKESSLVVSRRLSPFFIFAELGGLPSSGPHKLHMGKDIIKASYQRTIKLLEQNIISN